MKQRTFSKTILIIIMLTGTICASMLLLEQVGWQFYWHDTVNHPFFSRAAQSSMDTHNNKQLVLEALSAPAVHAATMGSFKVEHTHNDHVQKRPKSLYGKFVQKYVKRFCRICIYMIHVLLSLVVGFVNPVMRFFVVPIFKLLKIPFMYIYFLLLP